MEAIDHVFELLLPGIGSYRQANQEGEWIWDAIIGFKIKESVNLSIIGKNIFNNEYSLRPGMMEAPAGLSLKITFSP